MTERHTDRLQRRILIFAVVGILLTGLVAGLTTALPFYRHSRLHYEDAVRFNVQGKAQAIGQYLSRLSDLAMQFTSRSQIRDRLEQYNEGAIALGELVAYSAPRLRDAMAQSADVAGLVRLDAAGEAAVQLGEVPPSEVWPTVSEGSILPVIRGPVWSGDQPLLLVAAPIINRQGKRVGTDIVVFHMVMLQGLLANNSEFGKTAQQYLGNLPQQLLLRPKPSGAGLNRSLPEGALLQALKRGATGERGVLHASAGSDQVLFYAPVPGTAGWAFIVSAAAAELYAPALSQLVLPLLTILAMVVVGVLVTARTIRPLGKEVVGISAQLAEAGREQQALLELAQGFTFRQDRAGWFIEISPAATEVLGYTVGDLPLHYADLLTENPLNVEARRHREYILESASAPPAFITEVHNRAGAPVMLEVLARPVLADDGTVIGINGVARDVTQRVATEQALLEGEERLRTLIDATPDIICFKDAAGRWQEANDAALALFGLRGVDFQGRSDTELAALAPAPPRPLLLALAQDDERAWQMGGTTRSETAVEETGLGAAVFDVIRVPLFAPDGARRGLVVWGRDVTARRQVEQALARSGQEWAHAMDFFEDGLILVGTDDRIVRANRAFAGMVGLTPGQVIGTPVASLFHPGDDGLPCPICTVRQRRDDGLFTLEPDNPNNPTRIPLEVTVKMIRGADAAVTGVLMALHDLRRTRQTEAQLRLAASVFEGSQQAIMIMGPERHLIDVNSAFCAITGYAVAQVVGRGLCDFIAADQPDGAFSQQLWRQVDSHGSWQGEIWYRRRDGEPFPAWQNVSAVRDEQGRVLRYIGLFTDISEKKASEERIHRLAHYDLLTDLPNRVLLHDRLGGALDRMQRSGSKLGVLFLDLDRFKTINDSLGHPVGDRLLQAVAHRLNTAVREQDTVARLGGDEFLLILEDLGDAANAAVVAQKILGALRDPVRIDRHEIFVGASIGISVYPGDGRDPETLVKNADTAMYRAKELGRNNYQFYTPELTLLSMERFDLESGLRRAVERDELLLHYQPQATIGGDRIIGVEALVRWHHPEKGLIAPDRFIPLAEETGQILEIGRWVLRRACRQAQLWLERGLPLRMAVNLSGQQIVHGDIVQTVREALAESGLPPELLELELTEGFVLSHAEAGIQTMRRLKALGIGLAIDDFGTGYSSLSYLKRLPLDRLKIDRSFVQGIPDDRDDVAIAATIIAMARHLELEVIAEGVETPAQREFLRAQSCDEYQGFFLGRPLPVDELEALLSAGANSARG